jgi:hypothetical protein
MEWAHMSVTTDIGNPAVITVSRHVPVQLVDVFCNVR